MNHNILFPNGEVALCCMDYGMQHIIGNLKDDQYYDLFRSEEYNKVVLGQQKYSDVLCRTCEYSEPTNFFKRFLNRNILNN